MADRGAAALAKRLVEVGYPYVELSASRATAILGDRGCYLPDGLDAARLRAIIEQRFEEQGIPVTELDRSTIALAVDDILADLGVPMTDTVGGRGSGVG